MDFIKYQALAYRTAKYPGSGQKRNDDNTFDVPMYPVLGLCGESGEVAEKFKKILRDSNGKITLEKREEIKKELGDVLWYISAIAMDLDIPFDEIADSNISKLSSRAERGVISGSGDNR